MKITENILVFGTGFISKNILSESLAIKNPNLRIISISRDEKFPFSNKHYKFEFKQTIEIISLIKKEKINTLFFFLGPTFPADSFKNTIFDIKECLLPFIKILNESSKNNVKKIVLLSSAGTIYGSKKPVNYQEDLSLDQSNSYGIVLKAMESYLMLYSNIFSFEYKILRLSNVFGIYHNNNRNGVINNIIRKTLKNESVSIIKDKSKKNYIYSGDLAKLFWKIIQIKSNNVVVNISSDSDYSVNEICTKLKKHLPNVKIKNFDLKLNYDTYHLKISNKQLKELINFKFTSFDEALKKTIEWEKKCLK